MDLASALAYLDDHTNYDVSGRIASPSLERIARLMAVMGDPQDAAPAIHLTGTNGKGSTAAIATQLLVASGLTVGTYTSPHLERLNERVAVNGEPIGDDELGEVIGAIADLEVVAGVRPSYFEIVTAAAFRHFADVAVDVAVVEVGLLGRWDATNVVNGRVCVVTNVELDHMEYAGPTRADIAREKAGIVKAGSHLILGETDPELRPIFLAAGAAEAWERDDDFGCSGNELALGGRLLDLYTPYGGHGQVFLSLHGRHQGDNAACAVAAVEAFFGAQLHEDVLDEGLGAVRWPGRFEVLGHQPLVIVDGAHNPAGAESAADVFEEDFDPVGSKLLVVGLLDGRDPTQVLGALRADSFTTVLCCRPASPRAMAATDVARAAREVGCDDVVVVEDVARACDAALARADADDALLVTGSLYVVGEARPHLVRVLS
jgi:dihydrofolate synthase / folylpolyglutamate synthase